MKQFNDLEYLLVRDILRQEHFRNSFALRNRQFTSGIIFLMSLGILIIWATYTKNLDYTSELSYLIFTVSALAIAISLFIFCFSLNKTTRYETDLVNQLSELSKINNESGEFSDNLVFEKYFPTDYKEEDTNG